MMITRRILTAKVNELRDTLRDISVPVNQTRSIEFTIDGIGITLSGHRSHRQAYGTKIIEYRFDFTDNIGSLETLPYHAMIRFFCHASTVVDWMLDAINNRKAWERDSASAGEKIRAALKRAIADLGVADEHVVWFDSGNAVDVHLDGKVFTITIEESDAEKCATCHAPLDDAFGKALGCEHCDAAFCSSDCHDKHVCGEKQ